MAGTWWGTLSSEPTLAHEQGCLFPHTTNLVGHLLEGVMQTPEKEEVAGEVT